jgi:hypothetical protein
MVNTEPFWRILKKVVEAGNLEAFSFLLQLSESLNRKELENHMISILHVILSNNHVDMLLEVNHRGLIPLETILSDDFLCNFFRHIPSGTHGLDSVNVFFDNFGVYFIDITNKKKIESLFIHGAISSLDIRRDRDGSAK